MSSIDDKADSNALAHKIAQQNDFFRRSCFLQFKDPTIPQGKVVLTQGVSIREPEFIREMLQKLISFNSGIDVKRFEVQHETLCEGWKNVWTETDAKGVEQPQVFNTRQAAQIELDDFLEDIQKEIDSGDRSPDDGYSEDEFQIVPVQNTVEGFDKESDPFGWHDFGVFIVKGEKIWFKIDYYDLNYEGGVENPSDLACTRRVLTLMFPEEY